MHAFLLRENESVTKLSQEPWVWDEESRAVHVSNLLEAAERMALHGNVTARSIGRCRHAIIPGLYDWLAGELQNYRPPQEIVGAMAVACAPYIADIGSRTLMPKRIAQLPAVSAERLAIFLQEELT